MLDIGCNTSLAWLETHLLSKECVSQFGHFSLHVLIFFLLIIQPDKQETKLSVFKELIFFFFCFPCAGCSCISFAYSYWANNQSALHCCLL